MDNTLVFITDILVWTLLNVWFDKRIGRRSGKADEKKRQDEEYKTSGLLS